MADNLASLIRAGIDQHVVTHAAGLMKVYLSPNEANSDQRFTEGVRKLKRHYQQACDLLAEALERDDPNGNA